jgi:peptide/nickel transport system permease protein
VESVKRDSLVAPIATTKPKGAPGRRALRINPVTAAGFVLLSLILLAVLLAPLLTPHDPLKQQVMARLQPPSAAHPLGTDHLGRDLLARLLYGGRTSLSTSAAVLGASLALGVPLGLVAGYFGGRVDQVLGILSDLVMAVPNIVLLIFVAGMLGPSLLNVMLAFTAVHWVSYARMTRAAVLAERERDYVPAARAAGASDLRILARHIAPNIAGPLIVWATLDAGKVILGVAGFSFLGLGAQPPAPEWGAMLAGGRNYFQMAPQLMFYPGLAIALTTLAVNLVGDGIRDWMDPKNRLDHISHW